MADVFKYFTRTARTDYAYRTIAKHTAEYTLIDIHSFYFIEVHLYGTAADDTDLDDDAMIGDGKLI